MSSMRNVLPEWYHLRDAAYQGDFDAADALLRSNPELLDERNGIGETVLHFLAVEDCLHGIEWLHARGATLNTINRFGTPLLFEVAQLGHGELLLWLLAHGADPQQTDESGLSLRSFLAECEKPEMIAFIDQHIPKGS